MNRLARVVVLVLETESASRGRGRRLRFMGRGHLQNSDVNRSHEPIGIPLNRPPGTFSPTGGEGWDEGERFMESFHGFATAHLTMNGGARLRPALISQPQASVRARRSLAPPGSWKAPTISKSRIEARNRQRQT